MTSFTPSHKSSSHGAQWLVLISRPKEDRRLEAKWVWETGYPTQY